MAFVLPEDLHPDLLPVAWLLGQWHGNGRGEYPGTEPFGFEQDAVFAHDGRPFLHYFSRSWITGDDAERLRPDVLETGFLRPTRKPDDDAPAAEFELVLAHSTGYAEVWYGAIESARIRLATDVVVRTETAEEYTAAQRMYGLVEGDLMYANDKASQGHPMQSHTWGRLKRV